MVLVTNVVCVTQLRCDVDLQRLATRSRDVEYNPRKHNCLIWKHKKIGGCCMVSRHGKLMCNGKATSIIEARRRVRQYARLIQKAGYPIQLSRIRVITLSAIHTLSRPCNLRQLAKDLNAFYEPELFPALMFKREGVHFTCFSTGKVIVTGIKKITQLNDVVWPVIIELELL